MSGKAKAKALGLALAAMMAVGAVGAQGAWGDLFRFGPITVVTANQEAGSPLVLTYEEEVAAECGKASLAGVVEGAAAESITLHPKFSENCTLSAFGEATIDTDGCNYILTAETDEAGHAPFEIECESGHSIMVTGPLGCTITVNAQTQAELTGGITYENIANGDVTATVTVEGIHATANFACQLAGMSATVSNASLEGAITAAAFQSGGATEGDATHGFVYEDNIPVNFELEGT